MAAKRRRRRKHYIRNILGFLALALILGAVFVCLTMFTLSDSTVTGIYHESEKDVMDLVQKGPLKNNTLFLSLLYRDRKIKGNTFIDRVDITYVKHDTVSVRVREKNLVGYVKYKDRYWYFDRDGRVLVESLYNESAYKALAQGGTLPAIPDIVLETGSFPEAGNVTGGHGGGSGDAAGTYAGSVDAAATEDSAEGLMKGQALRYVPAAYLTDEETYVSGETAEYEEDAYPGEDDYEDGDAETGEYAYGDAGEDYDGAYDGDDYENGEYGGEEYGNDDAYGDDGYEDGGDGQDEVILIKPELIEDPAAMPIPADESGVAQPAATPIPAQEELVKEYKSEDTFAENYIPEITGLRLTEAVVGDKLPARYALIYTALDALKTYAETYGVYPTSVDISATGNLQIHFNDVTVNLGNGEHIERRLAVLGQILENLLGRSGTMHLENYDGTESRLIFSKTEKNS